MLYKLLFYKNVLKILTLLLIRRQQLKKFDFALINLKK